MNQSQVAENNQIQSVETGRHLIARGTVFLILAQASAVIGGMIIHVVGSRVLSYKQYSQFVLAISVTVILQMLLTTGFPKAFSFLSSKYPNSAWCIAKRGCLLVFTLSFLIFLTYSLICFWIGEFRFDSTEGVLVVAALVLPPAAILFSLLGILNGLQLFALESLNTSVYNISRAIIICVLLVITASVIWGLLGNTLAAIISAIVVIYFTKHKAKNNDEKPDLSIIDPIKKFGIPVTIYGLLVVCLMSLDIFIANRLLESDANRAVFSCAYTISRFLIYGSMALSRTIFPPLVRAISLNDQKKIQDILLKAVLFTEFTVLPLTIAVILYPDVLIRILYPEKYIEASALLPALAVARLSIAFLLIVAQWFMAAQKIRLCIFYSLLGCILVLLCGFLGFKEDHAIGIASGYALGCFLITVAAISHLSFSLKMHLWDINNFTSLVVATGLCGLSYYIIESCFADYNSFVVNLASFITVILVYPIVGFVFGVLKPADFNFIRSFFGG